MAKQTGSLDLKAMKKAHDQALAAAEAIEQFFWHNSQDSGAGEGAGAHITRIPQEDFIADPENGQENVLINSDGLSVRNGTDVLSLFGETVRIGREDEARVEILPESLQMKSQNGVVAFGVSNDPDGQKTQKVTYSVGKSWGIRNGSDSDTVSLAKLSQLANGASFTATFMLTIRGNGQSVSKTHILSFTKGTSSTAPTIVNQGAQLTVQYNGGYTFTLTFSSPSSSITAFPSFVQVGWEEISSAVLVEMNADITHDGDMTSTGDISANGTVSQKGHAAIGAYSSPSAETKDLANATSWTTTGVTFTPNEGRYLVCVHIQFASNATGRRGVRVLDSLNGAYMHSTVMVQAANGGVTNLQSVFLTDTDGSKTYTIQYQQSSGSKLSGCDIRYMYIRLQ